jgi:2-amino-4-hydroxy-6-hydroxymethyldihydropteridine diphosphokinase
MATAYIALGSNLGDRRDYLDRAVQLLRAQPGVTVSQVSTYYETEPVDGPAGQGKYLNAAAELQTDLDPEELLRLLLDVEAQLGRVRNKRNDPRTIDLDLLLYDRLVLQTPELTLPHPRMHERLFVLDPLRQIAPDAMHPILGRSVHDLWAPLWAAEWEAHWELAGLHALVTGSTSGIGEAIALELAEAGASVIVHGRRAEAAQAVAGNCCFDVNRAEILLADLRDPQHCAQLVDEAWRLWGGIDIWVNNAGADTLTGEAARWPFERKLAELWTVDVLATILLSREVGRRMKERGSGVILNMGWDQAETGMEGDSGQLFAATKGAIMAFTKSLAVDLAPQVRVNCLAPGWIRTAWGETASERWQQRAARETPLGRWGTPEDVARAARWLASPAAAFITGQTIRVNGGAVR